MTEANKNAMHYQSAERFRETKLVETAESQSGSITIEKASKIRRINNRSPIFDKNIDHIREKLT